jgi:glucosamine--fructose-6-phosphate aminotransferase (isomerizing)
LIAETRDIVVVEDDEVVDLRATGLVLSDLDGRRREPRSVHVDWDVAAAERGGFDDFMLKEIHEQPRVIDDTLRGRIDAVTGKLRLDELRTSDDELRAANKVFVVACGTSFHAGLVAKYAIEHWVRIPVEIDIASEFRYRDPVLDARTLVIGVSQSGETADTIAACKYATQLGAKVVAVTNVVGSSMARDADAVVYTHAGPEIGVAATKTFTCQIAALLVLSLYLGQTRGSLYPSEVRGILEQMRRVPDQVADVLDEGDSIRAEAARWAKVHDAFYLGRGPAYPTALEGALKMKEISYLHAEAYPSGELKHGPLALIEDGVPVISVVTAGRVQKKTISNVAEVAARGGRVLLVANPGTDMGGLRPDTVFEVPETHELLAPIVDSVVLQLLAYHVAKQRGCDVDKPRNLAKTVTVE